MASHRLRAWQSILNVVSHEYAVACMCQGMLMIEIQLFHSTATQHRHDPSQCHILVAIITLELHIYVYTCTAYTCIHIYICILHVGQCDLLGLSPDLLLLLALGCRRLGLLLYTRVFLWNCGLRLVIVLRDLRQNCPAWFPWCACMPSKVQPSAPCPAFQLGCLNDP